MYAGRYCQGRKLSSTMSATNVFKERHRQRRRVLREGTKAKARFFLGLGVLSDSWGSRRRSGALWPRVSLLIDSPLIV